MTGIRVRIGGTERLADYLDGVADDFVGPPMVAGMMEASLLVVRDAKILSPVDTGIMRGSITPVVEVDGKRVRGIVGSNVLYAPFQELGTRFIRARRFLAGAVEQNEARIKEILRRTVRKIIRRG